MKKRKTAQSTLKPLKTVSLALILVLSSVPTLFLIDVQGSQNSMPESYSTLNVSSENFTIVVLPDTQGYVTYYHWIFDNHTDWILDNAESLNIAFVTHLGDVVNNFDNLTQWENANRSLSKLDEQVLWGVLPGNHDLYGGNGDNSTVYNSYFGPDRFSHQSWFGGTFEFGDNANSYQLFSAGGDDYLIFHLQYNPSDEVLYWASNIIDEYPDRKVIVSTHDYLKGFIKLGERSDIGERLWHCLVKQHADQIFLVLCGHAGAEDMIVNEVDEHLVYQMLMDYQNLTYIESGWLRILEFCPSQEKIFVKTYSPLLKEYKLGSQSEFTIDYKTVPDVPRSESLAKESTIYIRPDGSVDPSSAPLRRDGQTYFFEDDISESLVVERSDVVIDGSGYSLHGERADFLVDQDSEPLFVQIGNQTVPVIKDSNPSYTGIYSRADNLTIKNLKITEFLCAIELEYSSNNCLFNNTITNNNQGVSILFSSNNTISDNMVSNCTQGITLTSSHNKIKNNIVANNSEYGIKLQWSFNEISGNNITNNYYGMNLKDSIRNVFRNNNFSQNGKLFEFSNWQFPQIIQDIDSSNIVEGKPIYYWIGKHDLTVPSDAGWIALVNCTRITVKNLNFSQGQEIRLLSTTESTVAGNILANDGTSLYLQESSENRITSNTITNSYYGILIMDSSSNYIDHNNITKNNQGIYLDSSANNKISKNKFSHSYQGIYLTNSHGNCIDQNQITNCNQSVYLSSSSNNRISENDISLNLHGLDFHASSRNNVEGNNFTSNEKGISFHGRVYRDFQNHYFDIQGSSFNNITQNIVATNTIGVCIELSPNNMFFTNYFVNNTEQIKFETPSVDDLIFKDINSSLIKQSMTNTWNNDKEGNFWSDYKDKYPVAEKLINSIIWSIPYAIDENNVDKYPLINHYAFTDQSDSFPLIWTIGTIATVFIVGTSLFIHKNYRKNNYEH